MAPGVDRSERMARTGRRMARRLQHDLDTIRACSLHAVIDEALELADRHYAG